MKNSRPRDEDKKEQTDAWKLKKFNRNKKRLGGAAGLSLETFANLKNRNNGYNPSLIKKQKEFYKNAKYIGKYKKSLKQHNQQKEPSMPAKPLEAGNEAGESSKTSKKHKNNNNGSLKVLYERKHEEEEKARIEKEAIMQAKKEEREKSEARRKATREKMLKKTRFGQPVMKYRIEHLLETIQSSNKNP